MQHVYAPIYLQESAFFLKRWSTPLALKIYGIDAQEIIHVSVTLFDGTEKTVLTTGQSIMSEEGIIEFLEQIQFSIKPVRKFEISTTSGSYITYSRDYRGQEFKRNRI